jgi:carbon-monoxide dehydrogenase small subunit
MTATDHRDFTLTVNGRRVEVTHAAPGSSLLEVLREQAGLTGTKGACEEGECGSCSVLVDGELTCSCLVMAAAAVGRSIVTVEGLADDPVTARVQEALVVAGAVQCGFCTPGFVVAATDLLRREAAPTTTDVQEALAGNLCRCTGYGRIVEAVHMASRGER